MLVVEGETNCNIFHVPMLRKICNTAEQNIRSPGTISAEHIKHGIVYRLTVVLIIICSCHLLKAVVANVYIIVVDDC